jgi:hypothetical protein
MRKFIFAAVLAASLTGCAASQNTPSTPGVSLVEQITIYTEQACGFLPAASAAH